MVSEQLGELEADEDLDQAGEGEEGDPVVSEQLGELKADEDLDQAGEGEIRRRPSRTAQLQEYLHG